MKKAKKIITFLLIYVLIFTSIPTNKTAISEAKSKIKLNRKKITLLVGKKKKLKLKNYKNPKKITWKSKNKKIATVTKKGWVKAKRAGKTTILCKYKYKGKKRIPKCKVTVKEKTKPVVTQTPTTPKPSTPTPTVAPTQSPEAESSPSLKEAYKERFPIGCALYSYDLKNSTLLPFIKQHYSTVTFENELKPESLLNQGKSQNSADGMPGINTDIIDECLSVAKENDLKVRFHTLIWHSQTPDWFFCENYKVEYDGNGTGKENITNLVDKETMLSRMESYITQIITYTETQYPDVVYAYDVVNEAVYYEGYQLRTIETSLYGAIFTNDDNSYITEAFRYADAARKKTSSQAKLFYNDFVGLESETECKAVVGYLADAKAAGTVDGIGIQAHLSDLSVANRNTYKKTIQYFGENGYEVQITEWDFANKSNTNSGNATLSLAYYRFMKVILDCMDENGVKVTNVTFWNFNDSKTWLNEYYNDGNTYYPSVFDENGLPKPAFDTLIDLVK